MQKWSIVRAKSELKPELREAAAATTLAAAHKSRCMRRALSQVSHGSWRLGVEGSLAEMGLMKLTSARARAQRVIEVRENRARVFESGVRVILTAMKEKDTSRCARLANMQKSDKEIDTLSQVRLQIDAIESL